MVVGRNIGEAEARDTDELLSGEERERCEGREVEHRHGIREAWEALLGLRRAPHDHRLPRTGRRRRRDGRIERDRVPIRIHCIRRAAAPDQPTVGECVDHPGRCREIGYDLLHERVPDVVDRRCGEQARRDALERSDPIAVRFRGGTCGALGRDAAQSLLGALPFADLHDAAADERATAIREPQEPDLGIDRSAAHRAEHPLEDRYLTGERADRAAPAARHPTADRPPASARSRRAVPSGAARGSAAPTSALPPG